MERPGRIFPKVVIRDDVVNQSDRDGATPKLIVIHTTESHNRPGTSDLESIAGWFNNPAADASSHVIVDDDGHSARCVSDDRKAWTCAEFNSVSLNIEQIGFARLPRWRWIRKWRELRETARWIARWSIKYGIPIEHASPTGAGVLRHSELGAAGGGHSDPGTTYPFGRVLKLARIFRKLQLRFSD